MACHWIIALNFNVEKSLFILVPAAAVPRRRLTFQKLKMEPLPTMVPSFPPKIITIFGWPVTGSGRSLDLAGHWIIALHDTLSTKRGVEMRFPSCAIIHSHSLPRCFAVLGDV